MADTLEGRRLLTTSTAFGENWGQTTYDPDPTGPGVHVSYQTVESGTAVSTVYGQQFNKATATLTGLPAHSMVRVRMDPSFYVYGMPVQGNVNTLTIASGGKSAETDTDLYATTGRTATPWVASTSSTAVVTLEGTANPSPGGTWALAWYVDVYTPTVSIAGPSSLDESDTTPVALTVSRDLPSGYVGTSGGDDAVPDTAVGFTTGGTATSGTDYTISPASSVTIANSGTSAPPIWLQAIDDWEDEPDETIAVNLTANASTYQLGGTSATNLTLYGQEAIKEAIDAAVADAKTQPGLSLPSWADDAIDKLGEWVDDGLTHLEAGITNAISGGLSNLANTITNAIDEARANGDPAGNIPDTATATEVANGIQEWLPKAIADLLGIRGKNNGNSSTPSSGVKTTISGKIGLDDNVNGEVKAGITAASAGGDLLTLSATGRLKEIISAPEFDFGKLELTYTKPTSIGDFKIDGSYDLETHTWDVAIYQMINTNQLRIPVGGNSNTFLTISLDYDSDHIVTLRAAFNIIF